MILYKWLRELTQSCVCECSGFTCVQSKFAFILPFIWPLSSLGGASRDPIKNVVVQRENTGSVILLRKHSSPTPKLY